MKTDKLLLVIVARALTIAVGALPATYLCLMAGIVALIGFATLLSGSALGLVFVLWALAGFYGTLSLWAVGLGFVRAWRVTGLIFGTIALLPIGGHFLTGEVSMRLDGSPNQLLFVTPILVALAWLSALAVQSFCRRPMSRNDAAGGPARLVRRGSA